MEMKRIERFVQLCGVIIILLAAASCRNTSPTSPGEIPHINLSITELDSLVSGCAGELAAVAFEVNVDCEEGIVPDCVPVNIQVERGPGQVSFRVEKDESNCEIKGLYYVILTPGDTSAAIMATAGMDTVRAEIRLRGCVADSAR